MCSIFSSSKRADHKHLTGYCQGTETLFLLFAEYSRFQKKTSFLLPKSLQQISFKDFSSHTKIAGAACVTSSFTSPVRLSLCPLDCFFFLLTDGFPPKKKSTSFFHLYYPVYESKTDRKVKKQF